MIGERAVACTGDFALYKPPAVSITVGNTGVVIALLRARLVGFFTRCATWVGISHGRAVVASACVVISADLVRCLTG